MKTFKRFSAILIAVFLMVSMMVIPASAAEPTTPTTYTITIDSSDAGHEYEAYQIFSGTLYQITTGTTQSSILTEIVWGSGVNDEKEGFADAFGEAAAKAASLGTPADALAFAKALVSGGYLGSVAGSSTEGSGPYTIDGLTAGYYLIKDVSGSIDEEEYHAYTDYILKVVKDVSVAPKASVPSLTKKVSTAPDRGYGESVSAAIAHNVYFELNASMPSLIESYSNYAMTFVDTLPAGLDYVVGSAKAYVTNDNDTTSTYTEIEAGDYTVAYDENTRKLTVEVKDIIESILDSATQVMVSDNIVVRFAATLNTSAVIGKGGNQNTAVLQYSNDPNDTESYGTTSEQTAEVYTYSLQLVKVDSDDTDKTLSNAQFRLWRYEGSSTTDKRYAVATGSNGVYTITGVTATESDGTLFTTDANGQFIVHGVNSGTYRLTEVTPPAGYNKLDSDVGIQLNVVLNATSGEVDSFSANKADSSAYTTVSSNPDTCVATITVTNDAGSKLPETGGIGTTIFYGIGGLLVIGALSLLIVRKRTTAK